MNHPSFSARPATAGLALAVSLAALTGIAPSQAASAASGITFATSLTTVQKPLPLFRLTRTAAPASFVATAIGKTGAMAMEGSSLVARDEHRVLHAYADAASGEAQIFPDLATTSGPAAARGAVLAAADAVFARNDVIPKDATQARVADVIPVLAAQATHRGDATQPQGAPHLLFTYVTATRYAAGLPVFGSGSQATVGIGNDGSIRAFVRRWQAAGVAGAVAPTTTSAQLASAIEAQLSRLLNRDTAITVDRVTPAYYDADAKFLQPVYEFEATLHPVAHRAQSEHLRGFVPFGKLLEPIPMMGAKTGAPPVPPAMPYPTSGSKSPMVTQITLGQYANRDGTMQDQANAYLNGFDSVSPWSYGPPINRTQWYWAEPWEVTSSANSYLNAVNVAYTMPHGDWYENTTYSNYANFWYVNQIGVSGNPGYGAASGGQLATWIIDSCEVAPSFYDLQYTTGNGYNAFNYWWPVFQGLHRVLAFRTQMLLGEDTMNYNIARSMAQGAAADSAFYNGVAAVGFPTYTDAHLNLTVHYDRVSIFRDTRNYNESIYSVQGQSASGQLNNVWMGN